MHVSIKTRKHAAVKRYGQNGITCDILAGMQICSFEPVFGSENRLLILGSMPSVKSLEAGFYYMHPRNRFWPLIARITREALPESAAGRRELLLRHRIALWDILRSCTRPGSMDSDIRDGTPNDIYRIPGIETLPIFCNGKTAAHYFEKYVTARDPQLRAETLPSTSPANQKYFDENKWLALRNFL